jgi:hypothetical protein
MNPNTRCVARRTPGRRWTAPAATTATDKPVVAACLRRDCRTLHKLDLRCA